MRRGKKEEGEGEQKLTKRETLETWGEEEVGRTSNKRGPGIMIGKDPVVAPNGSPLLDPGGRGLIGLCVTIAILMSSKL